MMQVYTSSPIEAHIIALFMKAQYAMARFFHGTPVFRGLLFAALTWAILQQFLRIATSRHQSGHAMLMIAYRVGMVFLAIGLLSWQASAISFSSSTVPWNDYPGVRNDPRYADTLSGRTDALWAYTLVYRALDSVTQTSAAVVGQAFDDETLAVDPTFLPEQLRRMDSFALSPRTMALWTELAPCVKKDDPSVALSAGASIESLFDLNQAGCQARWDAFQTAATADGQVLVAQYPEYVRAHLLGVLGRKAPGIGEEQLQQIAVSWAFQNSVRDLDDVAEDSAKTPDSPSSSTTASPERLSTQPERAQVNSTVRQLLEVNNNEASRGFQRFQEQAAMAAPMIPAARGYVEGILAVLFVVAAYSVGFGTWKYMLMWALAQASVCFYRPVALLGYKVAEYFMLEGAMAQQLAATSTDPLVFGGARILREQLVNIQSIYVCFELGAFLTFCVGAISVFRPISQMMMMPRIGALSHGAPGGEARSQDSYSPAQTGATTPVGSSARGEAPSAPPDAGQGDGYSMPSPRGPVGSSGDGAPSPSNWA